MKSRQTQKIAVLGSTGSVGQQALEVMGRFPGRYELSVLTAQNNAGRLIRQALKYKPEAVVIANPVHYEDVRTALNHTSVKVYAGKDAIDNITSLSGTDTVITAMTGISGLTPTLNAVKLGKKILLANKESLVAAGGLITREAVRNNATILPVDSEHSAIQQCLIGEDDKAVEKIYLTASGGPFWGMNREELLHVSKKEALQHPTWDMGDKISIDSATMMNKGLEMIEAKWLFDLSPHQIDVVIHPQSIIHSMVKFHDGSIKAQMGMPDMKHPIQYALNYPDRLPYDLPRFQADQMTELSLGPIRKGDFPCLDLAKEALQQGGSMPCVVNAANEAAVDAFLNDRIPFLSIGDVISECMQKTNVPEADTIEEILNLDARVKTLAEEIIKTFSCGSR